MQTLKNLKIIPNFIILNNLILIFFKVCKFVSDLLGISLFLVIILSVLNNDKTIALDFKFGEFEISFLDNLTIYQIVLMAFVVFFIKFLVSLLINYGDFLIKFKIYVFTQKLSMSKFYFSSLKNLIFKDNSKIYRSITTEVKFTSLYLTSIFSALANSFILTLSSLAMFFLIGVNVFLILIFFIICLGMFSIFFSKQLNRYGDERLKFNLEFYRYFHDTLTFLREIKFFKKSKYTINQLSNLKKKEWQAGYKSKFLETSTPYFIEMILISITLAIVYFNKTYLFKGSSEIIFVIVLMMRTLPYVKDLQTSFNEINLYKASFESFSNNFKKNFNENSYKILLNNFELKTKLNDKPVNLKVYKNEKVLIYNRDSGVRDKLILNLTGISTGSKSYLYLNDKLFKKESLIDSIGKIGYCDDKSVIFDLNLNQNIALTLENLDFKHTKKIYEICELLNLKKQKKDQVLDRKLIKEITKVKIGIARALYHGKVLFIFNNSFKNSILDKKTMEKVFKYIDGKFLIVLSDENVNFKKFNKKLIY